VRRIYPKFAVKLCLEYLHETNLMNDTAKEIENKSVQVGNVRSGAYGVILGCQMFDDFRAKIIASLPKDLPKDEFGKQLFERIYGAPIEDFLSGRVTDADLDR
jgi:hypothetical protein